MTGNINQPTRLLIILISIVSSISHAGLIFEYQGTKQFELNEEGKFSDAVINANVVTVPSSSALLFDHQGQTALWAENDHTINFTENFEAKTSAFPATGLLVQNTAMLQVAEILSIGRLYIAGENRQLVSAVAYADATALLEWNPSLGGYELKYHNIITPEGIEGRTEYPTNTAFYYIKDHLGSIREVISELGDMSESVQYHSYGNQDKTLVSSVEARETFTGKEYDEDGEVNGAGGIELYYFGARFFDPEVGVWTSKDPVQQYYNPYKYTANPICFIDPDGMMNKFWTNFWRVAGGSALA